MKEYPQIEITSDLIASSTNAIQQNYSSLNQIREIIINWLEIFLVMHRTIFERIFFPSWKALLVYEIQFVVERSHLKNVSYAFGTVLTHIPSIVLRATCYVSIDAFWKVICQCESHLSTLTIKWFESFSCEHHSCVLDL